MSVSKRQALIDADGVLIAHGFCDFKPDTGQMVVDAPDSFPYWARQVRWNRGRWEPYVAPAPVPTLTRRQVRLWLLQRGLKARDVATAVNTIADPIEQEKARIEWEDAEVFHYDHPLIASIATILGLEIHSLPNEFQEASKL